MNSKQSNITRSPDPVSGQDAAPSDPKTPPSDAGRPRDRAGRDAGRRNWKMFAAVCIVLFSVLVTMRVMNIMTNTPEYDEIWTVRNYRRIPLRTVFSDVSVPNTAGMLQSLTTAKPSRKVWCVVDEESRNTSVAESR